MHFVNWEPICEKIGSKQNFHYYLGTQKTYCSSSWLIFLNANKWMDILIEKAS